MIRKFGGATGIDIQPQGLDLGLGGSNIKSIQTGSTTLTSSLTSINTTISSIDTTKSIIILGTSFTLGGSTSNIVYVMGKITNSTTINFSRITSGIDIIIYWQVIEFNNVKSLQKGDVTVNVSNTDIPITVSSVNVLKSFAVFSFETACTYVDYLMGGIQLTSSTNLNIRMTRDTYNNTAHWQLIEFN